MVRVINIYILGYPATIIVLLDTIIEDNIA